MQEVTGIGDVTSIDISGNVKCDLAYFSQKVKIT